MTAANFDRALALVLVSEGGFADNPADPGGATNMGITIGTLSAWLGHAATIDDVKALTKSDAAAIYKANYWDKVRGDDLPSGLDYALFDFAVNSGPERAVKFLQQVIGVNADGIIGPVTLNATHVDPSTINADIVELCDARLAYLKSLPTFATFGAGWSKRVAGVKADAIRMAAPLSASAPILVTTASSTSKGTTSMSAASLKGLFGTIMGFAGVLIPFVPPQYQAILTAIVGLFGGAHAVTSAATNK